MDPLVVSNWGLVVALAAPHLLYCFIWFFPDLWQKKFAKDPVETFSAVAWLLKGMQFSTTFYWYMLRHPDGIDLFLVAPLQWLAFLTLVIAGQTLNIGIFRAIGHNGVYYGYKLGHTIPWVDGFPFNVVRHPQYVGSVLTVWSMAVLLWNQAPSGLGLITLYWTLLYVITGWMESSF